MSDSPSISISRSQIQGQEEEEGEATWGKRGSVWFCFLPGDTPGTPPGLTRQGLPHNKWGQENNVPCFPLEMVVPINEDTQHTQVPLLSLAGVLSPRGVDRRNTHLGAKRPEFSAGSAISGSSQWLSGKESTCRCS